MKRVKVLHVVQDLRYGGVEKMMLTTVDGLNKRGSTENVGCVLFDRLDILDLFPSAKIIRLGMPPCNSFFHMALLKPFVFVKLLWTIFKEDPDVIYAYYSFADQLLTCIAGKILGKKVVVRKPEEDRHSSGLRYVVRLTHMICDRVVTIFKDGRKELLSAGIPSRKIVYIPNGKPVPSKLLSRKQARSRLGLQNSDFVIGMVSRLYGFKNHDAVIKVLPELLAINKNVRFVVVGDGSEKYRRYLEQLIQKHNLEDHVIFLGFRKDVLDILPAFDVFVHPSFTEGCPGSVLEAMGAGLPIVASDAGGTKDLIKDCGIMISAEDIDALTDGLKSFMKNSKLREEYGKKARLKLQEEFSLDHVLETYENLFESLSKD